MQRAAVGLKYNTSHEEAFCLKSAPGLQEPSGPALAICGHLKNDSSQPIIDQVSSISKAQIKICISSDFRRVKNCDTVWLRFCGYFVGVG